MRREDLPLIGPENKAKYSLQGVTNNWAPLNWANSSAHFGAELSEAHCICFHYHIMKNVKCSTAQYTSVHCYKLSGIKELIKNIIPGHKVNIL